MQSDRRRAGTPPSRLPPSGLDVADLDRPIREVLPELARGIAALARLGIVTPRQALFYLPFRYDDFSDLRPLGELLPDEKQSARVRVVEVRVEKGFGRRPQRVIAQLADESGTAEAIWFGRQFVEQRLARIAPGDELIFSGKVALRGWRPQFVGPDFSPVGADSVHTGRVVPVYRLTGGVTQKRARDLLARVLERALPAVGDPLLPKERGALPPFDEALAAAHFPTEAIDVAAALDRLAFDELLALQLSLAQARVAREGLHAARVVVDPEELERLTAALVAGEDERQRRGPCQRPSHASAAAG